MHSIHTGKIGEIAVQKDLLLQKYNVYLPVVDSGIDLIVELQNGGMQRVQVKCVTEMKKRTSGCYSGVFRAERHHCVRAL